MIDFKQIIIGIVDLVPLKGSRTYIVSAISIGLGVYAAIEQNDFNSASMLVGQGLIGIFAHAGIDNQAAALSDYINKEINLKTRV